MLVHKIGGQLEKLGTICRSAAVWDTEILAPVARGDDRGYALTLLQTIEDKDPAEWQHGGVIDWANESYQIAADVIYKNLPTETGVLPDSYGAEMLPIVNRQLKRAGVRLANVLNEILSVHH